MDVFDHGILRCMQHCFACMACPTIAAPPIGTHLTIWQIVVRAGPTHQCQQALYSCSRCRTGSHQRQREGRTWRTCCCLRADDQQGVRGTFIQSVSQPPASTHPTIWQNSCLHRTHSPVPAGALQLQSLSHLQPPEATGRSHLAHLLLPAGR